MNWDWWLGQILYRFAEVFPWRVAGLTGLAVVSFSPLGRGLVRYLRSRLERSQAFTHPDGPSVLGDYSLAPQDAYGAHGGELMRVECTSDSPGGLVRER